MRAALPALVAGLVLTGCAGVIPQGRGPGAPPSPVPARPIPAPPPVAPPAPVAETALAAGVARAAALPALDAAGAARALGAFRRSCPALQRRGDGSGLTRTDDWAGPCARAAATGPEGAARFFAEAFVPVTVGEGRALATGYYEPEIAGSRVAAPGYGVPIYRRPPDLVEATGAAPGALQRGRIVDGVLVPYHDRAAIEAGALAGRGLELAWAADPVELFFLQVQGSGRLRLPGGGVMRIGYDGQNGHAYTGIGRLLLDRGELAPGQASMQGIMAYLRADPARGAAVMRENRSWVFFRELTTAPEDGPTGAMGLPVTPRGTVAVDPRFIPLGAPVWLALDRPEPNGLWIAQDTGGAIKGANRVDTFWGAGEAARTIAGGMAARGALTLLLPPAAAARLGLGAGPGAGE